MIEDIAKLACLCIDMGKREHLMEILTAYILARSFAKEMMDKWNAEHERELRRMFGLEPSEDAE